MKFLKRLLTIIYLVLIAAYLAWFLLNVQSIAARHMDLQLFYPALVCAVGVITIIAMGLCKVINKKIDKRYFVLPILCILAGVITFWIGYYTPCCIGG